MHHVDILPGPEEGLKLPQLQLLTATHGFTSLAYGYLLVTPTLVSPDPGSRPQSLVLLATDGRASTVERVRSAVWGGTIQETVMTVPETRLAPLGSSSLVALGAAVRVLRRSVLLEIAVPLLLNIVLATAARIAGTVLYLSLDSQDGGPSVALPWAGWSLVALAAVVAVLLATTMTLPFVRAATRPEALRTESGDRVQMLSRGVTPASSREL